MLKKESLVGVALIIILHVCLFSVSVSVSGQNLAYAPSSCCNMLNITDAFRLKGDPSGCGDRRYELAYENNRTVLNLYRGKYYVEKINHQNYRIQVVDVGLKKGDCLSTPLHRLTLENFSYGDPYDWPYSWNFRTTVLISCSMPISGDEFVPVTTCNNSSGGNSSYEYALSGDGESLQVDDVPGSCTVGRSIFFELLAGSEAKNRSMSSLKSTVDAMSSIFNRNFLFSLQFR